MVDEELKGLVRLADAVEIKALYSSSTLMALRGENPRLMQEGIRRSKGAGEAALYCVYVEEWPGLFHGHTPHRPNEEGLRTLRAAVQEMRGKNIEAIPIWMVSHNAAEAIANAAKALDVDTVMIGASRRSAFYHMLRGHVIKGLMKTFAPRLSCDDLQLASFARFCDVRNHACLIVGVHLFLNDPSSTFYETNARYSATQLVFGLGSGVLRYRHLGLLCPRHSLRPCQRRYAVFCAA